MSKSSARQRDSSSSASAASAPRSSDDVRRHDVHARRDRPGVEVVAVDHARRVEDVPPDVVEVHVPGRGLEQDIGRLAQEPERARQDQRGDQERGDRVGAVPAGQRDDDRRDDHGGRPTQVAEHLEICAAHVEAGALRVAQQEHRHAVRGEADERDGEHDARGDLRRIGEAPHRLEHDVAGDAEQQDGVRDRGNDLEPQVAECPAERRRPPREPDREQREPDARRRRSAGGPHRRAATGCSRPQPRRPRRQGQQG